MAGSTEYAGPSGESLLLTLAASAIYAYISAHSLHFQSNASDLLSRIVPSRKGRGNANTAESPTLLRRARKSRMIYGYRKQKQAVTRIGAAL